MSDRLRIGIVVSSGTDGGGERYLRELYSGLAERGHEPVLIGDLPAWEMASVPTGVTGKWSRRSLWRSGSGALTERRQILRTVSDQHQIEPFDLFHLQYKREQVLVTGALARLAPVMWTEHGMLPNGPGTSVLRALYKRAGRSVDEVVCVSEAVQRDAMSVLRGSAASIVVPNAVDLVRNRPPLPSERADARKSLGVSTETLVLATASRLHPTKGIDLAIGAMDHLPPEALLVVAGDGPDRKRLEQLAHGRPVIFTGHLTDVAPLFRASDVFLLPSTRAAKEGWPLTLLEAAAHGLPIVASCQAGVDSQVAAAGGVLSPGDPASFAARIIDAPRGQAGSAAVAWARQHGLPRWLDCYEELMALLVSHSQERFTRPCLVGAGGGNQSSGQSYQQGPPVGRSQEGRGNAADRGHEQEDC